MPKAWQDVATDNHAAMLNDLAIATAEKTIAIGAVKALSVPALCLVGEKSHRPMHGFVRRVARAIPNSKHEVIAGAAHAGAFDQPQAFADRIRALHRSERTNRRRGSDISVERSR
jgi:pimeloyl-ACP methyl ester carboxylesterase